MQAAEENARHIIIADWNDAPMDMYLIRFRDTGFNPTCANSLTLNARGFTKCESPQDLGPGRNARGCLWETPGWQYTNFDECVETNPELEVVQAGRGQEWIWINFIHSGAHHELAISVDEHELWVVAADGEFVRPQKVVRTHVNLGERSRCVTSLHRRSLLDFLLIITKHSSVLVKLDKPNGDYAIRLHSLRNEQLIQGAGILRYPTEQVIISRPIGMHVMAPATS